MSQNFPKINRMGQLNFLNQEISWKISMPDSAEEVPLYYLLRSPLSRNQYRPVFFPTCLAWSDRTIHVVLTNVKRKNPLLSGLNMVLAIFLRQAKQNVCWHGNTLGFLSPSSNTSEQMWHSRSCRRSSAIFSSFAWGSKFWNRRNENMFNTVSVCTQCIMCCMTGCTPNLLPTCQVHIYDWF